MSIKIDPPFISEGPPSDQIFQMKRYLFQLARQLEFAFNSIETEPKKTETKETTTTLVGTDVVIEQGNKGNWSYKKWLNGTLEAWSIDDSDPVYGVINGTFPFSFSEKPKIFASGSGLVFSQAKSNSEYELQLLDNSFAPQNLNAGISLYVAGRWKK